jgi:putative ABC transport system permease protein
MDELFGLSMNWIMYGLVVLLVVALASVTFVALTNRIMFKLGVRNIPRRRAQTTLIVLGLMLSTVIISAAFTTGDTVDRSITSEIYNLLGSLDETVVAGDIDDEGFGADESTVVQREQSFEQAAVAPLIQTLRQSSEIDAVVPVYSDVTVAVNPDKRLSVPLFNLTGLDAQAAAGLPDLNDTRGGTVHVSDLAQGEIYVNESAAEELEVRTGDTVQLFVANTQASFKVRAVVEDRRLAGSAGISTRREGGVVPLAVAQELFGAPGKLTMIAISNKGDSRGGLVYSDRVEKQIEDALASQPPTTLLTVQTLKQSGVNIAETAGNLFSTFFLAMGLFSIGAGVLLIFMIFVMLAAERKPEMGMARAVGTKRLDLVQTFLAEGMAYNVLAAMVGTGLGVLVAFVISRIMASVFQASNLEISPYVTVRSLVISYSLGVVLTFLTVTFSSWRVSLINIVQAIRDLPEPSAPKPQWGSRGFWLTLRDLIFRPADEAGWRRRGAVFVAVLLAVVLGAVAPAVMGLSLLIVVGVFFSYAWSQKAMPALFRIGVFLGTLLVFPFSVLASLFMTFQLGPVCILSSIPMLLVGVAENNAFGVLFGLSVLPLGIALLIRSFGANERLVYTLTGVLLIYIWEIDFSVGLLERIFGEVEGGPELFFLSGVMVTIAATFVVVYNADIILGPLTSLGKGLGALLPSIKMAVAYPLANKMRTGMTMAMFCLVVFALVVISSFNHNFNLLFRSDRALGGWDIAVDENPTNPIGDLESKLRAANSPVVNDIEAVGVSSIASPRNAFICQPAVDKSCLPRGDGADDFADYEVRGEAPGFLAAADIRLQARAVGYNSDEAAWQALSNDPDLAIIDSNALVGGFGAAQVVRGVGETDKTFEPVELVVADKRTGTARTVKLIGVIEQGPSALFFGMHLSQGTFDAVFGEPDSRRYFVQTRPGTNNIDAAHEIESALLTTGAQAESLRKQIDDQGATINGFFYLMQGFMGLGLFVGVAAVGVIAFRTVVERRQQIGMLRAIGYTRRMIGLTFLIESAFIAFMGVLSGVVFALILARQLITEQFANQGGAGFAIPWVQVGVISGLAFGFALLMTLIPSRQAASIPIAQALRYE